MQWTIYVPEEAEPIKLPASLSAEEAVSVLRSQSLVSSAYNYTVEANNVIRFARPTGGDKG